MSSALILANSASGAGTYNLSSGSLFAATETIGYSGSGAFTQTGGTNTISSALYLGNNAGSSGTYNLFGGLLVVPSIIQGSGSGALNFTGGTLTGGTASF